ncbi:hypothetical protein [Dactylosporangium sp. NPDC049140]|uniref:hypothetical protein n=1 Tax=Dactylosporangium sp. NPDC049140 TaxID=3155647 RepID=UPI0033D2E62C
MPPGEQGLRRNLATAAGDAGPPGLTAPRTRHRRAVLSAAAAVASVLVVTAAIGAWTTGGGPTSVYMCGERLRLPDAASSRGGLTMSLTVRGAGTDRGPDLTVTFTAKSGLVVTASPPELFQVLYLEDGVIVGGGPMLNRPGDTSAQGLDAIGRRFTVGPGAPSEQRLGPRDTLCPALTWSRVWSHASRYDVVVVQGPLEPTGPDEAALGIPLPLDAALLVARARLAG